jgi:hypothetical protein
MAFAADSSSPRDTLDELLCALRSHLAHIAPASALTDMAQVLLNASLEVSRLHAPRAAPFVGAPLRCAHDNQTWPCRTRVTLTDQLRDLVEGTNPLSTADPPHRRNRPKLVSRPAPPWATAELDGV